MRSVAERSVTEPGSDYRCWSKIHKRSSRIHIIAQLTAGSAPSAVAQGFLFPQPKPASGQVLGLSGLAHQVLEIVYKVPNGSYPLEGFGNRCLLCL